MAKTHRLDQFPYNHAGESLEFEIEGFELDTGRRESVDGDFYLSLDDAVEEDWEKCELSVSISVDQETLDHVFPPSEPNDGALIVVLYCPTNHYRSYAAVADGDLEPKRYENVVPLFHEQLRGRVRLTPQLIRTIRRPGGDRYSARPGHKLATGPEWIVDVDEPLGGRSNDLVVKPKDFSDPDFPATEANEWYVDIRDPAKPKLWINSGHPYIEPLLEHDSSQTFRGRVRSVAIDQFAIPMLTQFVLKAAELTITTGEISYDWQERMLTQVAGDVFGEEIDVEEIESMLEPGTLADTVNQIETSVQRRRTPHEKLQKLLEVGS